MSLRQTLQQDLTTALKAKDQIRVSTIRGLKAAIDKAAIDSKGSVDDDQRSFAMVKQEIKKRQDASAAYRQAGRSDLLDKEQAELKVLQSYQPAQLTLAELTTMIATAASQAPQAAFGPIMKQVMQQAQGRADGKQVQTAVQDYLANSRSTTV